jgi:hypothetical protein
MLYQLATSQFEKHCYIDSTKDISSLLIPWDEQIEQQDILIRLGTECCVLDEIKRCNSYIYPWTYKGNGKLVADNADKLQFLILDIDNGLTINEFREKYSDLTYYLYTSVSHGYKVGDRYRVILPITEKITADELVARRRSIKDYFSVGGKCFLDKSTLDRSRGFVVPINTPFFTSFENKTDKVLNLAAMECSYSTGFVSKNPVKGIEGTEITKAIRDLVELYTTTGEDSEVTVNGAKHSRNTAFYLIHVEIAKFRLTEDRQKQLADEMNVDGKRNTPHKTVEDARKACRGIDISALNARSKLFAVKSKSVEFLERSDVEITKGSRHLLSSTTGTGKTTLVLDKMRDKKFIFAAPLNAILTQNKLRADGHLYPVVNGSEPMPTTGENFLCSYNALINLLRKEDLSDYLIVLDEIHRTITEDFRIAIMSELVERLIAKKSTVLAMSGTYDESHFPVFSFDKKFSFVKRGLKPRKINLIETEGLVLDAISALLMSFDEKDNVLVLFDNSKAHAVAREYLSVEKPHIPFSSICSKDKGDIAELLKVERVRGVLMTTQVLLEGVNLQGLTKIVIAGTKPYPVESMVQFYERDRVTAGKERAECFLVRKVQDSTEEVWIPDAEKEKEYNNGLLEEVEAIGIDTITEVLGVIDVDKIVRYTGEKYVMNLLQPYVKQKLALDLLLFKTGIPFEKYHYKLTEAKKAKPTNGALLAEIKKYLKEKTDEELVRDIDDAFRGSNNPWTHVVGNFRAETGLDDIEIRKILLDKRLRSAYQKRMSNNNKILAENLQKTISVGDVLTAEEARTRIKNATKTTSVTLKVNASHYKALLEQFFEIKNRTIDGTRCIEILSVGLKGIDKCQTKK